MEITKNYLRKPKRDPHLHSQDHVLADELSSKLGEPKNFGYYLKTAQTTDHRVLSQILGNVLDGARSNPGALFTFLVKKYHREKNVSVGLSLCLLPEENISKGLVELIKSFKNTFNSPVFRPHLTLLSGLPAGAAKVDLETLTSLPSLQTKIQPVAVGDEFFKSIFLPVEKNKFLLKLRREAKKLFKTETRGTYYPHISLAYTNAPESDKRAAIKEFITQHKLPNEITFNRLALIQTQGPVSDWKTLQVINLTNSHDL